MTFKKNQMLVDLESWQKLQDSIAAALDISLVMCDNKGTCMTAVSNALPFCTTVSAEPRLCKLCDRCRSLSGYESFRGAKPFVFRCHMGLTGAAVPITDGDVYLGAVILCGVRLSDEEEGRVEPLYISDSELDAVAPAPEMTLEKLDKIMAMLQEIIVNSTAARVMGNKVISENGTQQEYSAPAVNESKVHPLAAENVSLLFPAFDYIATHFREHISLQYLSNLCYISPSYFSRLFARQTRETFPQYILNLRVAYAKQQLSTTDKSIAEIGLDSGFGDSSHFIKTFKKIEGVTPLQYRKKLR